MSKKKKKTVLRPWYHRYVLSSLRRIFQWSPARKEALRRAGAQQFGMYECACCVMDFPKSEIHIDHDPAVVDPDVGFVNWDTYIQRLFCDADNLRVLCKPCHKRVTKEQNMIRKQKREAAAKKGTK